VSLGGQGKGGGVGGGVGGWGHAPGLSGVQFGPCGPSTGAPPAASDRGGGGCNDVDGGGGCGDADAEVASAVMVVVVAAAAAEAAGRRPIPTLRPVHRDGPGDQPSPPILTG
jgi:hypothetical protein